MKHSIERCRVCDNYFHGIEQCKFCSFEWASDYPPCNDIEWDILNMDGEIEWEHLQVLDRLHYEHIPCLFADIWSDEMLYLIGCNAGTKSIARALGVDPKCVYNDYEHCFVIVNLAQEKLYRMGKDIDELWREYNE